MHLHFNNFLLLLLNNDRQGDIYFKTPLMMAEYHRDTFFPRGVDTCQFNND